MSLFCHGRWCVPTSNDPCGTTEGERNRNRSAPVTVVGVVSKDGSGRSKRNTLGLLSDGESDDKTGRGDENKGCCYSGSIKMIRHEMKGRRFGSVPEEMKTRLALSILIDVVKTHAAQVPMATAKMIGLVGIQPVKRPMMVQIELDDAQAKLAMLVRAFMMLAMPAMKDRGRDIDGGASAAVHQ